MKKQLIITLLMVTALISFTGCAELQKLNTTEGSVGQTVQASLPYISTATYVAVDVVLNEATSPADKIQKAKIISGVGAALYKLSTGTAPTVADVNTALNNAVPAGVSHWSFLIDSITSLYSGYFAQAGGDTKVLIQVVNTIAESLQSSTASTIAGN